MDIKFNNIDTYEITLEEGINWSITPPPIYVS